VSLDPETYHPFGYTAAPAATAAAPPAAAVAEAAAAAGRYQPTAAAYRADSTWRAEITYGRLRVTTATPGCSCYNNCIIYSPIDLYSFWRPMIYEPPCSVGYNSPT